MKNRSGKNRKAERGNANAKVAKWQSLWDLVSCVEIRGKLYEKNKLNF